MAVITTDDCAYSELPNKLVSAANRVDYAYRDTGEGEVPLVLLNHFRGTRMAGRLGRWPHTFM